MPYLESPKKRLIAIAENDTGPLYIFLFLLRSECHGVYYAKLFVTKMHLPLREGQEHPALLAPRVWKNPRRFHFDNIGAAMLALFEVKYIFFK